MDILDSKPLVSIGLFVYNGERYIRQALDSLLAQDYDNFELIISDNASTDKTQEICLDYAARDKRIQYYRNQMNMGLVWNVNRVFELSTGEYFMWAAHDDYWDSRYIRSCLEAFEISRGVVLAGTECDSINPETEGLIFIDQGLSTIGLGCYNRFKRYMTTLHSGRHVGGIFYGVYRRSALYKVMPMKEGVMGDHFIMAGMCFQGEFVTVPERLMVKRFAGQSSNLRNVARAMGIDDQMPAICKWYLLLKGTYFEREVELQRIIFQTDKLTLLEKIGLANWSLAHTAVVVFARGLSLGYQALNQYGKAIIYKRRPPT